MTTYEIETFLKSFAKSFIPIENGFAIVDGIEVDYSLSYITNQSASFKRILSPKNIFIISQEMSRDDILSVLSQLKTEEVRDDFSFKEIGHNQFEVIIDGQKCADVSLTFKKNKYFLNEISISNKKANKIILTKKLRELLSIKKIYYISHDLYKENYYMEYLKRSTLQCNLILKNNFLFGATIFTFKDFNF